MPNKDSKESISSIHDEVIPSRSFSSDPIGPDQSEMATTKTSSSSPPATADKSSSPVKKSTMTHIQANAGFVLDTGSIDLDGFNSATSLHNADQSVVTSSDSERHHQAMLSSWSAAYATDPSSEYTDARSSPQLFQDAEDDKKPYSSRSTRAVAPFPLTSPFSVNTAPFYPSTNKFPSDKVTSQMREHERTYTTTSTHQYASDNVKDSADDKERTITSLTYEVAALKAKNKQLEARLKQLQDALSIMVGPQQQQQGQVVDTPTSMRGQSPALGTAHTTHGPLDGMTRPRNNSDLHGTHFRDYLEALYADAQHPQQYSRRPSMATTGSGGFASSGSSPLYFGSSPDLPALQAFRRASDASHAHLRHPSTYQQDSGSTGTPHSSSFYSFAPSCQGNEPSSGPAGYVADDARSSDASMKPYFPPTSEHGSPVEVLVHRLLLSRTQEPSITLQHQLKSGTPQQRNEIIAALSPHFVRLAEDKHANFLIQRVITIDKAVAWKLAGQFATLSLSPFGCHVVQTVLQQNHEIRGTIVQELIGDRLYRTLTCRHSIHVWQTVLEMQWKDDSMRDVIFSSINDTMRGKWASTAMLETGSIMCQNIFESAKDDEKHECIEEILAQLCACAGSQWGVWVVQHIIEHSDEHVKMRALSQLLHDPIPLCLSPYGQKAIMSALKSGVTFFLDGFIEALCEREVGGASGASSSSGGYNRRSNLVEVATAASGLQIITQLITSVTDAQRELIIRTVRRNSVFLKGSKTGLKVHQMCERARAYKGY